MISYSYRIGHNPDVFILWCCDAHTLFDFHLWNRRFRLLDHNLPLHGHWHNLKSECGLQSDEEVEAAVAEANFFALVSHQFWGIWALIQARYSPIDFDYFGYSKLRWDEYYKRKEEFLSKVEPFFKS